MKIKFYKIGFIVSCILAALCMGGSLFVELYYISPEVVDEMFRSTKGLKVIISSLEAEISKLKLMNSLNVGMVFFIGAAIGCDLYKRIVKLENKSD